MVNCCEADTELEARRLRGSVEQNTLSGLGSRQSGVRYGLSGSGTGAGLNLDLVLNT